MKKIIILTTAILLPLYVSVAQVIPFGLQGKIVQSIRLLDDVLYAGTINDGVFKRGLGDTGWISLGLEGKDIRSIYPHHADASGFSILAGVYADHSLGDSTVIYGLSPGGWVAADSGVDRVNTYEISSINGMFKLSDEHIVYSTGDYGRLYKRSDHIWNIISPQWNVLYRIAEISPGGELWIGGALGGVDPVVAKSTDEGATWTGAHFDSLADNTIISLAFDPFNSDIVYASGAGGFIIKTTDAGAGWHVTTVPIYLPRLAIDPLLPAHLFCGGYLGYSGPPRLSETTNGGGSWEEIALPESLAGVRDLRIGVGDSLDLYLASAGSGVYRLRQYTTGFALKVTPGWNMISIPKHVPDYRKSAVFPTSTSAAFGYDGIYRTRDTLENGEGFWLKFNTAGTLSIAGDASINTDSIDVNVGWNMIGSISKPVIVSTITCDPPGIVTSKFYKYQGSYAISDSIKPGFGYWVKVNQSGKLILSSSGAVPAANRIRIVSGLELPPAPPAGLASNPEPPMSNRFALEQNYPNPFNPTTRWSFVIGHSSLVTLRVYDVLGREIAELVNEELGPGTFAETWDATGIAAGIYFYRLTAGTFDEVKKIVVAR